MADLPRQFDPPALLTQAHDTSTFTCGEAVLDNWLRQRAWANLALLARRTYVVCPEGSPRVAGYYAVSMGQILNQDVPGSIRRNMARTIPAVVLGRLAIDVSFQGHGLGRALLADAVRRARAASRHVSARIMMVHALSPAAEAFYVRHGFIRRPVETPILGFDLLKLADGGGE